MTTKYSKSLDKAFSLFSENKIVEAEELCRKIIEDQPTQPDALHLLGLIGAQSGHIEQAVELLQKAINYAPRIVDYHNNLGLMYFQLQKIDEAEKYFKNAAEIDPDHVESLMNLGNIYIQKGDKLLAAEIFEKILLRYPEHPGALNNLGNIYRELDRYDEAIKFINKFIELNPQHPAGYYNLALVFQAKGQWNKACDSFNEALKWDPNFANAWFKLGTIYNFLGETEKAIEALQKGLQQNPGRLDMQCLLGECLVKKSSIEAAMNIYQSILTSTADYIPALLGMARLDMTTGRWSAAEEGFNKIIQIEADNIQALIGLANVQQSAGNIDAAEKNLEKVINLKPDFAEAYNLLGGIRQVQGRFNDAINAYNQALDNNPRMASACKNLADARKYQDINDPDITRAKQLLEKLQSPEDKSLLHFSLGKMYDDCHEYELAYTHFEQANLLNRQGIQYDPGQHEARVSQLIDYFNATYFETSLIPINESEIPVFIVGMPRSGTTLIEQIVASHSKVFGADEKIYFQQLPQVLRKEFGVMSSFPEALDHIDGKQIQALQLKYLQELQLNAHGSPLRISDKMPANFLYLGLISKWYPKAKIIHCIREPLDVCLSIFFTHFAKRLPYASNLQEIVQYYQQYQRIMTHWQKVLPIEILHVNYEDVVEDIPEHAPQLIEYIGLDWEAQCLKFHRAPRLVRTASNWQARQPLYNHSVQRWQNYKTLITPLKNALEAVKIQP